VLESNDFAFEKFKSAFAYQFHHSPELIPLVISNVAYDWVYLQHGFTEDQFKAALYKYKIYENPKVSSHMQKKQM
jgi:hypothetical protein